VEAAGIEPASDSDASENTTSIYEQCQGPRAASALHFSDTSGQSLSLFDSPERSECVAELEGQVDAIALAWPQLPQHVRESILLLVQAALG
jgi:hypothetical protein